MFKIIFQYGTIINQIIRNKEVRELFVAILDAVRDFKITKEERQRILKEALDVVLQFFENKKPYYD